MSGPDHLEVVDTSDKLTKDEVKELKALAQMSRTAKWIMAGLMDSSACSGWTRSAPCWTTSD